MCRLALPLVQYSAAVDDVPCVCKDKLQELTSSMTGDLPSCLMSSLGVCPCIHMAHKHSCAVMQREKADMHTFFTCPQPGCRTSPQYAVIQTCCTIHYTTHSTAVMPHSHVAGAETAQHSCTCTMSESAPARPGNLARLLHQHEHGGAIAAVASNLGKRVQGVEEVCRCDNRV